uniref:Ubiquitin-like protease family profile domain-containing protein n=1 Tax=Meloidogyne enterolobii TaxID=390850 RepID=A0A6V7YAI2_MELEN|nr:unnamed protein product [Meloidogyne enterolobii]
MPSKQRNKRKLGKEYRQRLIANDGNSMDVDSMDGSLDGNNISFVGNFIEEGSKGENSLVLDNSDVLNNSIVSRSVSPNSISPISRGGRPKKRKNCGGRPKNVIFNEFVSNDNLNMNFEPAFLSVDLLDIPFGPVLHSDNRICDMNINVARDYIKEMWSDSNSWLQENYIYSYLKYLTTHTNKRVVVLDPAYSFVDYQYGDRDPLIPIENCFNHSVNYDILFIPICFPGHFGLVIYDRFVRNNPVCLFVDSLPAVDRLFNVRYPGFDIRRIDLIKRAIIDLTPNVNENEIQINPIPRGDFVEQFDGVNCGFFVCLYSELYLFNNNSLLFPNLNIHHERKRILWNLSQLILSNDINYVGLFDNYHRNAPVNNNVFSFNLDFGNNVEDNCVINDLPVLNLEPDPPLRRSERIKALKNNDISDLNISNINIASLNKITPRCHLSHKLYPCADVRARHVVSYYDSGNIGDAECCYCGAMLFNSEINDAHYKKFKKISSSYCCRCGVIKLPSFKPHPQLLKDLTKGDTKDSLDFLKKQNVYNSLLAFASVYVGHRETKLYGGVCYLLNGEFVRKMSSMVAGDSGPSFSQLYILDADTAFQHRVSNVAYGGDRVNPDVLKSLDTLLRNCHPLANTYKSFHEQYLDKLERDGPDSVQNFRLVLLEEREAPELIIDNTLHVRQVNLPTEETLFSLHTESDEPPILKGFLLLGIKGSYLFFHHIILKQIHYVTLFCFRVEMIVIIIRFRLLEKC